MSSFTRLTHHAFDAIVKPWANGCSEADLISHTVALCRAFSLAGHLIYLPDDLLPRLTPPGFPALTQAELASVYQSLDHDEFARLLREDALVGMTEEQLRAQLVEIVRVYYERVVEDYGAERRVFEKYGIRVGEERRALWDLDGPGPEEGEPAKAPAALERASSAIEGGAPEYDAQKTQRSHGQAGRGGAQDKRPAEEFAIPSVQEQTPAEGVADAALDASALSLSPNEEQRSVATAGESTTVVSAIPIDEHSESALADASSSPQSHDHSSDGSLSGLASGRGRDNAVPGMITGAEDAATLTQQWISDFLQTGQDSSSMPQSTMHELVTPEPEDGNAIPATMTRPDPSWEDNRPRSRSQGQEGGTDSLEDGFFRDPSVDSASWKDRLPKKMKETASREQEEESIRQKTDEETAVQNDEQEEEAALSDEDGGNRFAAA